MEPVLDHLLGRNTIKKGRSALAPRSFPCSEQPLLPQMLLYVPWHGSTWGLILPLASGHLPQFSPSISGWGHW